MNLLQNAVKFGDVPLNDKAHVCVRVWTTISWKASQWLSNSEIENSIFSHQPQHEMKIKRIKIKPLGSEKWRGKGYNVSSVVCSCG